MRDALGAELGKISALTVSHPIKASTQRRDTEAPTSYNPYFEFLSAPS